MMFYCDGGSEFIFFYGFLFFFFFFQHLLFVVGVFSQHLSLARAIS